MKALLKLAIWVCCILLSTTQYLTALPIVGYDLDTGGQGYTAFLGRLRSRVSGQQRTCGFFVTPRNPGADNRYILADLIVANGPTRVRLGIDAKNLYVWGYRDRINGRFRATFLNDAPPSARNELFTEVDQGMKTVTSFGGNYIPLTGAAGTSREDFTIGLQNLQFQIENVFGKNVNARIQARFFLTVIQVVSEAARFRYIQNQIAFSAGLKPPPLMIAYENNWDTISQAIHRSAVATPACRAISPPVVLQLGAGEGPQTKTIAQVSDVRDDIGLLKYNNN